MRSSQQDWICLKRSKFYTSFNQIKMVKSVFYVSYKQSAYTIIKIIRSKGHPPNIMKQHKMI